MSDNANLTVSDNPDQSRYEVTDDSGVVSGFAAYQRRDDVVVLTHTEVDDAYEGQGVGSALARGALDDIRASDLRVQPDCQFIAGYIESHPEYADLVDER